MASVSMVMPLTASSQKLLRLPTSDAFFKPLPVRESNAVFLDSSKKSRAKLQIEASFKERTVAGVTAAALTAAMVVPEVAMAADSLTPSLKNFLLSISAGGFVLFALIGAVIGVSNFDPVKRS